MGGIPEILFWGSRDYSNPGQIPPRAGHLVGYIYWDGDPTTSQCNPYRPSNPRTPLDISRLFRGPPAHPLARAPAHRHPRVPAGPANPPSAGERARKLLLANSRSAQVQEPPTGKNRPPTGEYTTNWRTFHSARDTRPPTGGPWSRRVQRLGAPRGCRSGSPGAWGCPRAPPIAFRGRATRRARPPAPGRQKPRRKKKVLRTT